MFPLTALLLHALAGQSYGVLHKFPIPGDTGWDLLAVAGDAKRLYISRGTHVQVMDTETGKIVTDITDTPGVHGIALAPKLNKGFITNGRDNSVTVFDLKTDKETARVKVGTNPDAILFDAASVQVFSFNGRSSDATVIDAKTDKVVGTVALDGKPELPVSDGHGHVYVNLEDKSMVAEIDTKTLKVTRSWSLSPGEGPTGIAIDAKKGLVFSTCDSMMVVSDIKSGKVVGTAETGSGTDSAGYDPSTGIAFASNGDGSLSLVQSVGGEYKKVQDVTTKQSARTMALDPKHHLVYLIAADFDAPQPGQRRGTIKPGSTVIIVVGPTKGG
jgi:YVTN family beta-propeller protein